MRRPSWLVFLASAALVGAQDSPSLPAQSLDVFPECSRSCFVEAFLGGICELDDPYCTCNNEVFRQNITACVDFSCTIPEQLVVQNTSATTCLEPVRDRSGVLTTQTITVFAFAFVFFFIRIIYKVCMKLELGLDDAFLTLTALAAVPTIALFFQGLIPNGLARDLWTLSADQVTEFLKYWYIVAIVYFLQVALIKLAFITFYLRIFTTRTTKRLLWGTFAFVALWGVAFVVLAILVCKPISYLWTQWDGLHEGRCVDDKSYVWTHAVMNIAMDLWILAIPMWELRKLQLHWKKKVGVVVMFCLGAFVTIVSILRLRSLVYYQHRSNVTWEFYEVSLWSSIEIGVGIICACLPTIRLLLVKIWPVLSGSTARSGHEWYRSGGKSSSNWSGTNSRGGHRPVSTSASRDALSGRPEPGRTRVSLNGKKVGWTKHTPVNARSDVRGEGVRREQSFTVSYKAGSDGSDISLVLVDPEAARTNPPRQHW